LQVVVCYFAKEAIEIQSRISRTPYPPIGGHAFTEAQNSVPSPFSLPEKTSIP